MKIDVRYLAALMNVGRPLMPNVMCLIINKSKKEVVKDE